MFSKCFIVHLWFLFFIFLHMHVFALCLHCTVQKTGEPRSKKGFTNQIWNSTGMFPACYTKRKSGICHYWDLQLFQDVIGQFKISRSLSAFPSLAVKIWCISRYTSAAAMLPMISLNILLRAGKKNLDWHLQILVVNKPFSAALSVEAARGPHLPLEGGAACTTLNPSPR